VSILSVSDPSTDINALGATEKAMTATSKELTSLDGFEPESVSGVRIFSNVRARGNDVIEWAEKNPSALDGSRWIECDLDTTVWPKVLRDVTIVDSSLRDSVWEMENGENIRILGTTRIPMHFDAHTEEVVADISNVSAVVDGMRLTGHVSGFCFLRVAGKNVMFGEPGPGFFEQTELPLVFGGNLLQMASCSVQLSYLEHFTVYSDSEDMSIYRNGLPDFRLGGRGIRSDVSWNLAPGKAAAA
jgi:hypothetical protein